MILFWYVTCLISISANDSGKATGARNLVGITFVGSIFILKSNYLKCFVIKLNMKSHLRKVTLFWYRLSASWFEHMSCWYWNAVIWFLHKSKCFGS